MLSIFRLSISVHPDLFNITSFNITPSGLSTNPKEYMYQVKTHHFLFSISHLVVSQKGVYKCDNTEYKLLLSMYYIKYAVSWPLSQNSSRFHPRPEKYHSIISFDIQDENLEHDEMSTMRHAIVGIHNRGCIGYYLVLLK